MSLGKEVGISAVLVIRNEENSLDLALNSLVPDPAYEFPWEILVVDNGSTDRSHEIFQSFAEHNPTLICRWITNGENNLGSARARAMKDAKFSFVAFLDGDCVAARGWLGRYRERVISMAEQESSFLALGSGNFPPPNTNRFCDVLSIAFSSPLGNMSTVQAKPIRKFMPVGHLPTCNVCYVRERVLALGNFSKDFSDVCEDLELSWRAKKAGFNLYYLPGQEVWHRHKPGWKSWAAKMFRYGRGQIEIGRLYPEHLMGIKGIPLLLGMAGFLLVLLSPMAALFLGISWLAILFIQALVLCWNKGRVGLTLEVAFALFLIHFFYSLGEVWGLLKLTKKGYRKVE